MIFFMIPWSTHHNYKLSSIQVNENMLRRDYMRILIVTGISSFMNLDCALKGKTTRPSSLRSDFEVDVFKTSEGELKITFVGHGSYMFTFNNLVIHFDPWSTLTDYSKLPKADIVLVTHEHMDHLDPTALDLIRKDETVLLYSESCAEKYKGGHVTKYGDVQTIKGIKIETVPAYNIIVTKQGSHPYGWANGYVFNFGDMRVYSAGETEIIPEMERIKDIDIALFSVDSVFNMTPEMAAEAAKVIKPKVLYPIHFKPTLQNKLSDLDILVNLLKDEKEIDIRIRKMQ